MTINWRDDPAGRERVQGILDEHSMSFADDDTPNREFTLDGRGKHGGYAMGFPAAVAPEGWARHPAPRRARDVPDARIRLTNDCVRLAPLLAAMPWVQGTARRDFGRTLEARDYERVDYLIESTRTAALYFVEPDLCDLIAHAWRDVPATTLTDELPPDPVGIVFFARPMTGIDADNAEIEIRVDAVSWMWVNLLQEGIETAVGIISWQCVGDGLTWSPLGRTDWPLHHDTDTDATALDHSDRRMASQSEDRRLLATLWLLASQERVTETQRFVLTNKSARRRFEREHRTRVPTVNVIDVRRPKAQPGEHTSRDVAWSHRWLVSGHWRQQVYGEGRLLRRPQWIAPYVKGPGDKPLAINERVKRLAW
jgi:hypothetical protein